MDLEKDRKVVMMIPHSDDELITMLSVMCRHPNPKNIYAITIVNEPVIQNLINGYMPELAYGTQQINEVLKSFDIPEENCLRVHKAQDIVEHCFSILSLIKPDEVYCPAKEDGHDDHQMLHHATKRIQTRLGFKTYGWVVHCGGIERPKPDYVIPLKQTEIDTKEQLRRLVYPGKRDVPVFLKERFGDREEFYDI